jgi:hypothetical protein
MNCTNHLGMRMELLSHLLPPPHPFSRLHPHQARGDRGSPIRFDCPRPLGKLSSAGKEDVGAGESMVSLGDVAVPRALAFSPRSSVAGDEIVHPAPSSPGPLPIEW